MNETFVMPVSWTDADAEMMDNWLRANHIDPRYVPVDAPIRVGHGEIRLAEFQRDADGKTLEHNGGDAPCVPRRYPLLAAPDHPAFRRRFLVPDGVRRIAAHSGIDLRQPEPGVYVHNPAARG